MDILRDHREEVENLVRNNVADNMARTVGGMPVANSKNVSSMGQSNLYASTMGNKRFPGKYYEAPKPIQGMFGDMVDNKQGYSEKFSTKIKVDNLDQDYSGDLDLKTAKTYITAL